MGMPWGVSGCGKQALVGNVRDGDLLLGSNPSSSLLILQPFPDDDEGPRAELCFLQYNLFHEVAPTAQLHLPAFSYVPHADLNVDQMACRLKNGGL